MQAIIVPQLNLFLTVAVKYGVKALAYQGSVNKARQAEKRQIKALKKFGATWFAAFESVIP